MIDYQANGTLLGSMKLDLNESTDRWLILVKYGNEFVISQYINGHLSWVSGRYFRSFDEAQLTFIHQLADLQQFKIN